MNARFVPTSLPGLLRSAAAGIALVTFLAACGGSHAADSTATAAPGAAASTDANSTAASSAPDAASSPGEAGGAMSGKSHAGGRRLMAKALASLGLSDDQKSQIRSIMKAARAESVGADPATKRANYQSAVAKVEAVLTPEQLTAYHAKIAELRAAQSSTSQ